MLFAFGAEVASFRLVTAQTALRANRPWRRVMHGLDSRAATEATRLRTWIFRAAHTRDLGRLPNPCGCLCSACKLLGLLHGSPHLNRTVAAGIVRACQICREKRFPEFKLGSASRAARYVFHRLIQIFLRRSSNTAISVTFLRSLLTALLQTMYYLRPRPPLKFWITP